MKAKKSYNSKDKTLIISKAAIERKADNVVVMNMRKVTTMCDFFIVCSGNTDRKIKAIADNIIKELKKSAIRVGHIEGYNEANWILIDCYDVIVHVFRQDLRDFYDLEHLWAEAPRKVITEKSVKKTRTRLYTTN